MTDILSLEQKTTTMTSSTNVLQNRNFRLLWIGEGISLLGDQFYLIALPWHFLSLTGNPLAIGMVLVSAPNYKKYLGKAGNETFTSEIFHNASHTLRVGEVFAPGYFDLMLYWLGNLPFK